MMKESLGAGLGCTRRLTVTGKSLKQNLAPFKPLSKEPANHRAGCRASQKRKYYLVILRGNLAPEGSVAKIAKEGRHFSGVARVLKARKRRCAPFFGARSKGDVIVKLLARRGDLVCAKCFRQPAR